MVVSGEESWRRERGKGGEIFLKRFLRATGREKGRRVRLFGSAFSGELEEGSEKQGRFLSFGESIGLGARSKLEEAGWGGGTRVLG